MVYHSCHGLSPICRLVLFSQSKQSVHFSVSSCAECVWSGGLWHARRSRRNVTGETQRNERHTGTRALAVPDGRRSLLTPVRLPRANGIVAEKNRAGGLRDFALFASGRPRHRLDEQ